MERRNVFFCCEMLHDTGKVLIVFIVSTADVVVVIIVIVNVGREFLLLHPRNDFLGGIEDSVGLYSASVAPLALLVVLQCALLTEVVLTLGHHRVDERFSAEDALERQLVVVRRDLVLVII